MNQKPYISIIIPGIRVANWKAVYDSICDSTNRSFELIFSGPYDLPENMKDLRNVKFVKDFGSPVRSSCVAASLSEGKLLTWSADDALVLPGSLDKNIELLENMGDDERNVIVCKYLEGKNGTAKSVQNDEYFRLSGSDWTSSPYLPKSWWLFNAPIMYRTFFEELGGWDCQFKGTFYSHADMAVRAQFLGANVKMSEHLFLDCDHSQDDHFPIEKAQVHHDKPVFLQRYRDPNWTQNEMRIKMDNWKDSPSVWERFLK